jgi:hypothetical protein
MSEFGTEPSPILTAALGYAERGWSIIPLKPMSKVPAIRSWRRYQQRQPSVRQIKKWFASTDGVGMGVILGKASGGLACRDFDTEGSYEAWAAERPELASTLPTVATSRGRHVYFQIGEAEEAFLNLSDGELRADCRHYTVLPESTHPSGVTYTWTVSPGRSIPILDPTQAGFLPPPQTRSLLSCVKKTTSEGGNSVWDVVEATLPAGPGVRHRRLFDLARALKGIPDLADVSADGLELVVRRWWEMALPVIRTKDWRETWADFTDAWRRVRHRADCGSLAGIREFVCNAVPLSDSKEQTCLLRLELACEELSRRSHGGAFPLSCRIAGDLIDCSWESARRYLERLACAGMLTVEFKAKPAGPNRKERLASMYRWTGLSMAGVAAAESSTVKGENRA